ncbi:MAG: hypothetical protein R2684_06050 [Pyrinomonadaceae bacterium]
MKVNWLPIAIFVILTASLSVFAQETAGGKRMVDTFWKAIQEERVVSAENTLKALKRREPKMDFTAMDKALNDLQNKREKAVTTSRNRLDNKLAVREGVEQFLGENLQLDSFTKRDAIDKRIADHARYADLMVNADKSEISEELETGLNYVEMTLRRNDEITKQQAKFVAEALTPEIAETNYMGLLLRESYWKNVSRVYPDRSDFSKIAADTATLVKGFGTQEERAQKAIANYNAKVDAERLPRPTVSNASLEALFKSVFINESKVKNRNYTFLKSVVTTSDWGIRRNQLTGIILGRGRTGVVAFKDNGEGKCFYGYYGLYQQYVGGKFLSTTAGSFDSQYTEIRCENVLK